MKKIFILSLLGCICSPLTFAKSYNNDGVIEGITLGGDWMRVKTTDVANDEGCDNQEWLKLVFNGDTKRSMYTTIIAAKLAGQVVHFELDGCEDGYASISNVYVN